MKTVNNKISVSSVFNGSEGLYGTTACQPFCLVRRPYYFARLMRFGSRGRSEFAVRRNALTEIAWEDTVQGLGMAMSTVASGKNREMSFFGNLFYKQ